MSGLPEFFEQSGQFQQIGCPKGRPAGRDDDKRVVRSKAGPPGGKRSQLPLIVVKVDAIVAPVLAIRHQFKLATEKRMKRMRHPKSSMPIVAIGCN